MEGRQKGAGRVPVGEWIRVDRRKQRVGDRWSSNMETTFFIENLPEEATNNILWKSFGKVGRLSDAYVAKKKDAAGNRFGFLRFLNVKDINDILKMANEVRVLEAVVQVSLARFDRSHRKFVHQGGGGLKGDERWRVPPVPPGMGSSQPMGEPNGGRRFYNGGPSFKDVVNNDKQVYPCRRSIHIPNDGGLLQQHWVGKAVVGEGWNIERLEEVRSVLDGNGFKEVGVSYLGGMKVLITFHDKKEALEFLNGKKQLWEACFKTASLWNGEALPIERVAGLVIRGVPLQLREDGIFNDIGGLFGKVVGGSKFTWGGGDSAVGRCHVLVNHWEKVDEIIDLSWKGKSFAVQVLDDGGVWSPKMVESGIMEDGEFRQSSPENRDGDAGEEGEKVEGERAGRGSCMHGEMKNNNEGGSFKNSNNFEGHFGNFDMGSGRLSRKKRKRMGDGSGPSVNGPNSGWEIPIRMDHQVDSSGLNSGVNKNVGQGSDKAAAQVNERGEDGPSGELNQERRNGPPVVEPVVDTEMENLEGSCQSPKSGVEAEVEETVRVGRAVGIDMDQFRSEVEEMVSGDGVFEGPK